MVVGAITTTGENATATVDVVVDGAPSCPSAVPAPKPTEQG